MTTSEDLIALADRCKLEGKSATLDADIALALGWTYQKLKGDGRPYWRSPGNLNPYNRDGRPAFTGSLNASIKLIKEHFPGVAWSVTQEAPDSAFAWVGPTTPACFAPTPESALCAAMLCAMARKLAKAEAA